MKNDRTIKKKLLRRVFVDHKPQFFTECHIYNIIVTHR